MGPSSGKACPGWRLEGVLPWGLHPFDLSFVEAGIADLFAQRLLAAGLLPTTEVNDACILAEASVAGIPVLVTSDQHLLSVEEESLAVAFEAADLLPVTPAHPKALLRALE